MIYTEKNIVEIPSDAWECGTTSIITSAIVFWMVVQFIEHLAMGNFFTSALTFGGAWGWSIATHDLEQSATKASLFDMIIEERYFVRRAQTAQRNAGGE